MEDDIEHCGMTVFRICAFHTARAHARGDGRHAGGLLPLPQVDIIAGDANMAAYRVSGSRQGSSSIHESCFQEMVRFYLKAYTAAQRGDPYCCPKARFVSANPLTLLRWMEDKFSIPWKT